MLGLNAVHHQRNVHHFLFPVISLHPLSHRKAEVLSGYCKDSMCKSRSKTKISQKGIRRFTLIKSENLDEKWKIKIEMKRVTNETTLILLHSEWGRLCFPFYIFSVNIALLCNPIFIPFCEYFFVNIALLCNPSPLLFPPQTQFHQAVPPLQTNIPIDGSSSWRQRHY